MRLIKTLLIHSLLIKHEVIIDLPRWLTCRMRLRRKEEYSFPTSANYRWGNFASLTKPISDRSCSRLVVICWQENICWFIIRKCLKIICGTEPHPAKYRAKKYKVEEKYFSFTDFRWEIKAISLIKVYDQYLGMPSKKKSRIMRHFPI